MEKLGKISFYLVFGFSALAFGYLLGFWTNFYYLSYKFDPVRLSNERALKDVYGGKTPEETYGLFVSALKQSDIELASKYFVLGKQDEKLEEFKKIKKSGELTKYIDDLPEWGAMRENGNSEVKIREFLYPVILDNPIEFEDKLTGKKDIIPKGIYNNSVIFHLNSTNNIWKIERL